MKIILRIILMPFALVLWNAKLVYNWINYGGELNIKSNTNNKDIIIELLHQINKLNNRLDKFDKINEEIIN